MRYFITLSYDGTRYHGWQIQPNGTTVQEQLQTALSTLTRRFTPVVGAGRTDTGVHAGMMVAHFDLPDPLPSDIVYKLNRLLPHDIAVQDVSPVSDDMHARFSAKWRTYHYSFHTKKDPFLDAYSWHVPYQLDFEKMNEAAQILPEYTDFTSFSKTGTDQKTNLCNIREARLKRIAEGRWLFVVTANRFLRGMVRAIVGTLIEVGRGRLTAEDVRRVIEAKDRQRAGESVPARGLSLTDITY